jgi:hypothetical protein
VAAQAVSGAARSLPEGDGTWRDPTWLASSWLASTWQGTGGSNGSSSSSSGGSGGGVVFRGRWVGGVAHGDGVWTATYPYCEKQPPAPPHQPSTLDPSCDDPRRRALRLQLRPPHASPHGPVRWRCEEREGRWRRGVPVPGEWRLQWTELDSCDAAAASSRRARPSGVGGHFVGHVADGRPGGGGGAGVCKYPRGGVYTGPWQRGKRDGPAGCFVWPDGASFDGAWAGDRAACQTRSEGAAGVLRFPDGRVHVLAHQQGGV